MGGGCAHPSPPLLRQAELGTTEFVTVRHRLRSHSTALPSDPYPVGGRCRLSRLSYSSPDFSSRVVERVRPISPVARARTPLDSGWHEHCSPYPPAGGTSTPA